MDPYTQHPTLVLICDVCDPITREKYSRDPRYIAKKAEAYLKSTGIGDTCFVGPEAEFFIFDSARFHTSANEGYYYIDSKEGVWNSGTLEGGANLAYKTRHKQGYFRRRRRTRSRTSAPRCASTWRARHQDRDPAPRVATAGQAEIDMQFDTLVVMADKLMKYKRREERRAQARHDGHLYAQAALPGQRLGHAHAPVDLEGRQAALRRRPLRGPFGNGAALHRWPAETRSGHYRVGFTDDQQLQASGTRL
jgi:glutamine synthetase